MPVRASYRPTVVRQLPVKTTARQVMAAQIPVGYTSWGMPYPDDPRALMAMYKEWVYTCVKLVAQGVSHVPLRLYAPRRSHREKFLWPTRKIKPRVKRYLERQERFQRYLRKSVDVEEVVEHPFYDFWDKGNPFLTGMQNKMLLVMQLDLVGDSYWYIEEGEYGPEYCVSLPPDEMKVELSESKDFIAGYVQRHGTKTIHYAPEEVMHVKWPDPNNPVYGYAPLEAVGLAASLYHKMNVFESSLMDHGASPSIIGVAKAGITEPERRRSEYVWNSRFMGPARAGKFAIISGDVDIKTFGLSQREMQFPQGRVLTRQEIAAAFNVPDSLLVPGDVDLANVKVGEYSLARHAILPRCCLIEEQINRDIMPKYDPHIFVAFDNPVPQDDVFRLQQGNAMLQTENVVYQNELRAALGVEARPEFEGKLYRRPGTRFVQQKPNPNAREEVGPEDERESITPEERPSETPKRE